MITKEQWQVIEGTLLLPYESVKLRCDGHEVTGRIEISKNKLIFAVYVDECIKGEWMDVTNEIGIKFYEKKTKYLLKPQERKDALKNINNKRLGKDLQEMFKKHYEAKYSYVLPYWTSAKSFFRHIRKTCQSIELIE